MPVTTEFFTFKTDIPLKSYSHIKIGGPAHFFCLAHSIDTIRIFLQNTSAALRGFFVLGNGSNILIDDAGITTPVIKLGAEFDYIRQYDAGIVEVGAATPLAKVVAYTMKKNLSGLENLAGIPATIGGLIAVNASSFGQDISSKLEQIIILGKDGYVRCLKKDEVTFGYRTTSLKDCVIINATFRLTPSSFVRDSLTWSVKRRLSLQDYTHPSLGCVFKNPPATSAGALIERTGLKGFEVGGARISRRHANFIINRGWAKAADVSYLIQIVKERVYEKFGVELEEEIIRWEK